MKNLLASLEDLRRLDPTYHQAVENVLGDVCSTGNPHGNLKDDLVRELDDCCCAPPRPVTELVREHCCIKKPALHREASPGPILRRALPLSQFVGYHLVGTGAALEADVDDFLSVCPIGSASRLLCENLKGSTGAPTRPSWWTFDEPGRDLETDGWAYARQLALGEVTLEAAEEDGALVELEMETHALGRVFKPTSLEGFGPNTPFRPELTGADHGRTVPEDPAHIGRPEVVSASQTYSRLAVHIDEVAVRVLPYNEPT